MKESKKQELAEKLFFEELKDTFFFQVHRLQKVMFRQSNRLIQEAGISLQLEQFPVLMMLHALGSSSQQEIADIIGRDKSSVQRTVTVLQQRGLLAVTQDAADKRRNIVTLTPEGVALARKLKNLLRQSEEEVLKALSPAERQQATRAVKGIADKLEKL